MFILEKNLEFLKELFTYSAENVIFSDYDFNVIWYNKKIEKVNLNCASLEDCFEAEQKPLKSGNYNLLLNGYTYKCSIINYPDINKGLYVIQMENNNVIRSFLKCKEVREFFMNQAGAVRQAVTGISVSNNMLYKMLEEEGVNSYKKYFNITIGNCYRLLKTSLNVTELVRYTDGSILPKRINISKVLGEFSKVCNDILGENVSINADYQPELYIIADIDRLLTCLLSMLLLVHGGDNENDMIIFSGEKISDSVSITASAEKTGGAIKSYTHSRFQELYEDNQINSDRYIVNCFCKEFGGTLFVADRSDKNKSYNIRLPFSEDNNEEIECRSVSEEYSNNRFSKFHIALSDIADIVYY